MDVKHVASLANLSLSAGQEEKFTQQFSETLKTISLINELDTANTKATYQVTGLTNVVRPDVVDKERILPQSEVLSQAKQVHNGYIVVPRTIQNE